MIDISSSAQTYLQSLVAKQDDAGVAIRIFVTGTPQAEPVLLIVVGEEQEGDIAVEYDGFRAWFEGRSEPYLEDAQVDYQEDQMGGQLTIKAPNARVPKVGPDAPIEDRINYVLYNEINPGLAAHGGVVSLVEVTAEKQAVCSLASCQGCSAVGITPRAVLGRYSNKFRRRGVVDHTDHSFTENACYTWAYHGLRKSERHLAMQMAQ